MYSTHRKRTSESMVPIHIYRVIKHGLPDESTGSVIITPVQNPRQGPVWLMKLKRNGTCVNLTRSIVTYEHLWIPVYKTHVAKR